MDNLKSTPAKLVDHVPLARLRGLSMICNLANISLVGR